MGNIVAIMVNVSTITVRINDKSPVLRGRLKGNQLRKLPALLDMHYTPSELAEAIGFTRRQVYRAYLPLGCPHEKDEAGHVFINGHQFKQWYREIYKKLKLDENEGFCLACKCVVRLFKPVNKQRGNYQYWEAICPNCNGKIAKAITR
jgi:hypothetical protein